jgi:hypothetical protein
MSTEKPAILTLGNVLLAGATTVSDRLGASLESGPEANQIKAALAKAAPGLPLGTLLDGISKAVQDALDVPVADVLIGAWQRARDLRAAFETTRESANATVLVPLLGHAITSEHRPYVDIVVEGVPLARLVFPVKVEFRLEGVVVRVRQGQVADILAGSVTVKGTLKFGDFVLLERALAPISIPGVLAVTPAQAA